MQKAQRIYSLVLCLTISFYNTYAQDMSWVKGIGSVSEDIAYATKVDLLGNVYTAGTFKGVVNFSGTVTPYELTASGTSVDVFITKTTSDGTLLWAKRIGNTGTDYGQALAVDENGAVYVTGRFAGTVDFDPNLPVFNLTSSGYDVFLLKLNSSGDFVWAKKMGGSGWDVGNAITVDKDKNVFVTGRFDGTANFNTQLTGSAIALTALGQDVFVVKLDQNGHTIWAKRYGGNSDDWGQGIDVDNNGAVYVTGFFREEVAFGILPDQTLTSVNNTRDVFLLKLDNSGEVEWVKGIVGASDNRGEAVRVDFEGNILMTGRIGGVDIAFGDDILLSPGSNFDAFVAKLSPDGGYTWAKNVAGSGDSFGMALDTDSDGAVYITGSFKGTADLNPGSCDLEFVSAGDKDIFVFKLDTEGFFVWGRQLGGIGEDSGNAIAVDFKGSVYTAGYFIGTADFNANLGGYNITSKGDKDIFIHKIIDESTLPLYVFNFKGEIEGDFNNLRWNIAQQEHNISYEVERAGDVGIFTVISAIENPNKLTYFYSDKSPLNGPNYYRIKQVNQNGELFYTSAILLNRKDLKEDLFSVYPNPIIGDLLTISRLGRGPLEPINVAITDLFGRNVYRLTKSKDKQVTLATNSWPKGVYIIEIQEKSEKIYFKVIK